MNEGRGRHLVTFNVLVLAYEWKCVQLYGCCCPVGVCMTGRGRSVDGGLVKEER